MIKYISYLIISLFIMNAAAAYASDIQLHSPWKLINTTISPVVSNSDVSISTTDKDSLTLTTYKFNIDNQNTNSLQVDYINDIDGSTSSTTNADFNYYHMAVAGDLTSKIYSGVQSHMWLQGGNTGAPEFRAFTGMLHFESAIGNYSVGEYAIYDASMSRLSANTGNHTVSRAMFLLAYPNFVPGSGTIDFDYLSAVNSYDIHRADAGGSIGIRVSHNYPIFLGAQSGLAGSDTIDSCPVGTDMTVNSHPFRTGDKVRINATACNLTINTDFWACVQNANTIKLDTDYSTDLTCDTYVTFDNTAAGETLTVNGNTNLHYLHLGDTDGAGDYAFYDSTSLPSRFNGIIEQQTADGSLEPITGDKATLWSYNITLADDNMGGDGAGALTPSPNFKDKTTISSSCSIQAGDDIFTTTFVHNYTVGQRIRAGATVANCNVTASAFYWVCSVPTSKSYVIDNNQDCATPIVVAANDSTNITWTNFPDAITLPDVINSGYVLLQDNVTPNKCEFFIFENGTAIKYEHAEAFDDNCVYFDNVANCTDNTVCLFDAGTKVGVINNQGPAARYLFILHGD